MFPYENSDIVSVCPYHEKRNHPSFINISPTLAIDTSMGRSSRVLQHRMPKISFSFQKWVEIKVWLLFWLIFLKKHAYLSVSAVMFFKQSLAYTVHIDWCNHAIHKHSRSSQHMWVLTKCTFIFRQVCTIELHSLIRHRGMHRRHFEGRHLVYVYDWLTYFMKISNHLKTTSWMHYCPIGGRHLVGSLVSPL